jgi:DNA topoisomerase-1
VHPNALPADMGQDERAVYELIWRRTVACQMKDARGQRTTMTLGMPTKRRHGQAKFVATGKTIEFPGYRLAYVEDLEDAESRARREPNACCRTCRRASRRRPAS